ncbi:hypothetical protein AGABI1DRAFT_69103 [Agaricus bisporus var. burnettii JB137-S8]|uniref:Uncharacterized protein n=1 Tax=Agaricus bisporus var. burnettii (strain JB137-S8 / ATCC MYA-4627 / FGSC 10392) TaxID=597362 RepID=K5XHQ9_AGABU|nr:uncharacterized protein AGABI1DRAFT_69103 [Agaricus bisporus var. burnettii JB137-S8]EKM82993.1 hypothetical protein AGABI1DRAFT_69103 [Agaricus bisporus var. burnettii JB137-S8]
MFSRLPQKFSAPFGLLGDEAKLAFPTQPGGILKLAAVRNIPASDNYWEQYFVLFDSASDVFSLIAPHHIRRALIDAPENVATLIQVVTSRLFNLVSDHTFPSTSSSSVTALASSFIKSRSGSIERNTTKEVLNCLRILQRVLPVVFDVEGESNAFELELLWKKEEVDEVELQNSEEPDSTQFVIEDEEDNDNEVQNLPPTPGPNQAKPKKQLPSLGERLFSCIFDLLFCCGFTLPIQIQVDHHKINYVIWEKGVGSTVDSGFSHAYDNNRIEVLRLLLVLLSRQIYVPPGSLFMKPSFFSLHLVRKTSRRDVLTLLCSLLNVTMNSGTKQESGISNMAGKLPYNHLVFKGEDPRSNLVGISLQILCTLLDFQSGSARDATTNSGDGQVTIPTARTNGFRYFLMKLHRIKDFDFIIDGIIGILEQQMAAINNVLPGARKSVPYINETILFCWKVLELNKKLRLYLLDSDKSMVLLAYLLTHALEVKDKPQQHGLCRALSYIVQTLSADSGFGSGLRKSVKGQIPAKYNNGGTMADFLIQVTTDLSYISKDEKLTCKCQAVYSMVATTSGTPISLYPALIIALSNAAPYFRNLSVTASTRLVQLFTSFSNPMFLLSDEGHPRILFFMLEAFNSVILHNLANNPNLIYAILSSHKVFEDIGTFTLARGLRDIRRVQLAEEGRAHKPENDTKNRRSGETVDPGMEKLRLLSEEGNSATEEEVTIETSYTESEEGSAGSETIEQKSKKAQGKMRERQSLSEDNAGVPAASVGRNGFVPTQEWVTSWQQGLPLDIVLLMISELLPKIQEIQASRKATSSSAAVDFLANVNLQHVLPSPPPVVARRFVWSDASIVWLTSLIWGEIYVRGMTPLGIWNATNVRLFYVKHSQAQQRQLTDTVTNVVGGLLRRTSESQARRT